MPEPAPAHRGRGKKLTIAAAFSARPEWFEDETVAQSGVVIEGVGEYRSGAGGLILVTDGKETPTGKRSFRDLISVEDRMLVQTYRQCAGGLSLIWPGDGSLLDQPVKLVRAFGIIGATLRKYEKKGP